MVSHTETVASTNSAQHSTERIRRGAPCTATDELRAAAIAEIEASENDARAVI